MDVIELIKKDHDKVEELFARYNGGGGLTGLVKRVTGAVSPRTKRSAVEAICRELDIHARVEEEIFYPRLEATGDPNLKWMVNESLGEHATVKEHVAVLREGRLEGDELDNRVSALQSCVDHHVNEEESEMLPRVEQLIAAEERADLGKRVQARKRALAGRTATARATRKRSAARSAATQRGRKSAAAKVARRKKRARGRAQRRK